MKSTIRLVMLLIAFAFTSSMVIASAPIVTWTDATGTHQLQLSSIAIDPGDPYYVGQPYGWYGLVNMTVDDNVQQIVLSASGDYTISGEVCYAVLIDQYVLNNSSYVWHTFRLDLDGLPEGTGQSFYYDRGSQPNWSVDLDINYIEFFADNFNDYVMPGQTFMDKIVLLDPDDKWNPNSNADFVITKTFQGELIPEPGTLAAITTGMIALGGFALRRKR